MARKSGSHSATTRPRIMDAALKLFAQKGYAAVSMREIASEAGVQAGSIYNYVPDKQALLYKLLHDHMTHLLEQTNDWQSGQSAADQLSNFVRFHIDYHLQRPELVFIAYMELRNLSPQNYKTIAALRQDYEGLVTHVLIQGSVDGEFEVVDPKLTSFALIAMLTGVVSWFRPDGAFGVADIQDKYLTMVHNMVNISG